ncbi:OmpA family protein [Novosphingobium soli]|uniref:OmpA family protein n=1 Tax=Novosphingobium soli TaxID=574956 RepID=A0ABV6CVF5_9SPHN
MRGMPALTVISSAASLMLCGCNPPAVPAPDVTQPAAEGTEEAQPGVTAVDEAAAPTKSIIRADLEAAPVLPPAPEPLELTIPFPAKGTTPEPEGLAALDTMVSSPTVAAGGTITIWGHSDSRGTDSQNLAASRRRAEAVRDYLEGKGIDEARITVIPLGEARPLAPNRKLDGSDDPEGRRKNRRVEIRVEPPEPPADAPDESPGPSPKPTSKAQ